MKSQPIPQVSLADVERIVRRDFPEEQFDSVMALLAEYDFERERPRVLLAALKLANGRFNSLRRHIEVAARDYRDVLVAAEYPEYWRSTLPVARPPDGRREEIIDRDWKQYEDWLKR